MDVAALWCDAAQRLVMGDKKAGKGFMHKINKTVSQVGEGLTSLVSSKHADGGPSESLCEISGPTHVVHEGHIGYSKEGGIDMSTIPDSWREVFEAAGVSRQDLLNPTTSKEVLKFVGDFLAGKMSKELQAHVEDADPEELAAEIAELEAKLSGVEQRNEEYAKQLSEEEVKNEKIEKDLEAAQARIVELMREKKELQKMLAEGSVAHASTTGVAGPQSAILAAFAPKADDADKSALEEENARLKKELEKVTTEKKTLIKAVKKEMADRRQAEQELAALKESAARPSSLMRRASSRRASTSLSPVNGRPPSQAILMMGQPNADEKAALSRALRASLSVHKAES